MQIHLALFARNQFPANFGGHLEFMHKMQKRIYLENSARWSDFDEIFWSPSIHNNLAFFQESLFLPFAG